ncbi:short-chain dehydrogenase [Yersinia ruckeri]|uniref:SDR family NAD(P)-dependent oxidoreductase n=1 Tax=Yersinia ruckeri TaxID=29486 RepID=UPI0004E329E8|nr:SDR family NAD(P)-dependent oxidoreductase [Yersinia ruckeri]ARY99838.1 3-hydroxy acid dehydrogenase [Yersinia ruckeri]ELI6453170.1 SDR family NAD(P)-dependent oxidoreductase [Yersinia ruckeri]KFE37749.1 short-chain dehydrogenase [Yersinia ruckeri]OIX38271.1 short-chain dehydrogenase [Yersinia ruckeri]OIX38429.1 short-chain dehydrogenase [Yersinia ruckeri]
MKHVVVTGASSGIGQQLALDYAAEGWQVTACGRDENRLMDLGMHNPAITACHFDITDLAATRKALAHCPADLVILCAGTCEYLDNGVVEAERVARVLNTNFLGPINCLDVLLPQLSSGSRIALVGSTASMLPMPRAEAYGASKAALAYFARSLAVDLAKSGINVSLILPGFVATPLTDRNDFTMPMIITPKQASHYIRRGLGKGAAEIAFPPLFAALLRLTGLLPQALQRWLAKRLVR